MLQNYKINKGGNILLRLEYKSLRVIGREEVK